MKSIFFYLTLLALSLSLVRTLEKVKDSPELQEIQILRNKVQSYQDRIRTLELGTKAIANSRDLKGKPAAQVTAKLNLKNKKKKVEKKLAKSKAKLHKKENTLNNQSHEVNVKSGEKMMKRAIERKVLRIKKSNDHVNIKN